ncbi:helix-turn-helix transcriptional regulator [Nocardia cyriacigeorgica]|uniref:Helix-turn-helix domain-containing protein n=1 Tax=Nocardia cyriacigeorgica TaxID=135487 RepID=A0A5R8PFP7_9NOCA|nr:AraC family transcriptional regulator [Nocardia cyriacigeorgica]MBF6095756.1 AraC family transcriptional regulator [Nocardia cyriacigeorgica]TLF73641.1 helix-turn-helix domain-containing protein [Nocardia cyriacigeorgica]TLG10268.1 helix-turn-helix domain-containing protein [Nocardia cyriacigeorgica]
MSDPTYHLDQLNTTEHPKADRLDSWTDYVTGHHGALSCNFSRASHDFIGASTTAHAADVKLVEFTSHTARYRRTPRHLRDGDFGNRVSLIIPVTGTALLEQTDTQIALAPGQLGVISMARPLMLTHTNHARIRMLTFPHDEINHTLERTAPIAGHQGRTALAAVSALTSTLAAHRESVTSTEFLAITTRLTDLLAETLHEKHDTRIHRLAADAHTYITNNAGHHWLTPDAVAHHLGCSKRTLERALNAAGTTPGKLIRDTRLDHAHRLLIDQRNHETIHEIATMSGFLSIPAFNKAFRARYGVPPSHIRANGTSREATRNERPQQH